MSAVAQARSVTIPECRGPAEGDVLITLDQARTEHYAIAQLPGGPQISWSSRDDAQRVAVHFARRHAVDVWLRESEAFTLLASHRSSDRPSRSKPVGARRSTS